MSSQQILFLYLKTVITKALLYDGWIEQTSPFLPRSTSHSAVGYNPSTHTIYLLGGIDSWADKPPGLTQLVSFNYIDNTFTDHNNADDLPRDFYGWSQNYVQMDSVLYFADRYNPYINSFNMETEQFTTDYITPQSSFNAEEVCIVNIRNDYLGLLGHDKVVQILDIHTQTWLNDKDVPSLQIGRTGSSCIYINDKVFIIGGLDSSDSTKGALLSIEYLDVPIASMMNIKDVSWEYNVDSLPHSVDVSRCITVNDDIVVIGGYNPAAEIFLDTIYTINSITGSVALSGHLAKAVYCSAVVFVNSVVYSFGGWTEEPGEELEGYPQKGPWDGWQTKSGIIAITAAPTEATIDPSNSPSKSPSNSPSNVPSKSPSNVPSNSPSNSPSNVPSDTPSISPSNVASYAPSHYTTVLATSAMNTTPIHVTNISLSFMVSITSSIDVSDYIGVKSNDTVASPVNVWFIVGVITSTLLFILLVLIGCFAIWFKRGRHKQTMDLAMHNNGEHIDNNNANIATPNADYDEYNAVLVAWFIHTLQLPQYIDIFIQHGYDNILLLELIEDKSQLVEIGVTKEGHQSLIMHEINKLRKKKSGNFAFLRSKLKKRTVKRNVGVVELEAVGPRQARHGEKSVYEKYTVEGAIKYKKSVIKKVKKESDVVDKYTEEGAMPAMGSDETGDSKITIVGGIRL